MVFLDLYIIVLLHCVCIMLLCGYYSLCERKILAIFQMRTGPCLFFFGILTPINDGIKLLCKFVVFIVSYDVVYLIGCLLMVFICIFYV